MDKKLAGKLDSTLPEVKSSTAVPGFSNSDNPLCVKELEITSLTCGSNQVSLKNTTPTPGYDTDLLNEQAILQEFLDTTNIDSHYQY